MIVAVKEKGRVARSHARQRIVRPSTCALAPATRQGTSQRSISSSAKSRAPAEQRGHRQPDIHGLDVEHLPALPEQDADAGARAGNDELGPDDDDEREAEPELAAGQDQRQRARQRHRPVDLPAAGP